MPRYGDTAAYADLRYGRYIWGNSGFVSTLNPLWSTMALSAPGANTAVAARVVIPRSGTLNDMSYVVGTSSGNVDIGVYSITGAGTRTRLWSSGSTAAAGTNAWQTVGDPGLTVAAGDLLDFILAFDNGTATMARISQPQTALVTLPSGVDPTSATLVYAVGTSFPLPASFSGLTANSGYIPYIAGNVD